MVVEEFGDFHRHSFASQGEAEAWLAESKFALDSAYS